MTAIRSPAGQACWRTSYGSFEASESWGWWTNILNLNLADLEQTPPPLCRPNVRDACRAPPMRATTTSTSMRTTPLLSPILAKHSSPAAAPPRCARSSRGPRTLPTSTQRWATRTPGSPGPMASTLAHLPPHLDL